MAFRHTEILRVPSQTPPTMPWGRTHSSLQALFDLAQDAFPLADDQSSFIDGNAAACKLTGYSRSELLRLERRQLARELHDSDWAEPGGAECKSQYHTYPLSSESAVRVDARLVEAFGGRLLIEAAPGHGTRIVAEVSG